MKRVLQYLFIIYTREVRAQDVRTVANRFKKKTEKKTENYDVNIYESKQMLRGACYTRIVHR